MDDPRVQIVMDVLLNTVFNTWMRRNKARADGKQWEVGYTNADQPISEDTMHIVGAYASGDEAEAQENLLYVQLQAQAIVAALEPQ